MTPFGALLQAAALGSTLPWVLTHAPDGGRDAALHRAWNACDSPGDLLDALHLAACGNDDAAEQCDAAWDAESDASVEHGCTGPTVYDPCALCCDAIRAVAACPTWEQVTRWERGG